MNFCDACGSPKAFVSMGGAVLCRQCEPEIQVEMDKLRAAGKPVNVLHIARRIYRETNSGGNYLLRDIPETLWSKAKHRAVDDGDSLRDLVLKSVHKYIEEDKS